MQKAKSDICNQQVVGSSPTNGSITKTLENIAFSRVFLLLGNSLKRIENGSNGSKMGAKWEQNHKKLAFGGILFASYR